MGAYKYLSELHKRKQVRSPWPPISDQDTLADSCVLIACRAMSFASCSAFAAGNTAS